MIRSRITAWINKFIRVTKRVSDAQVLKSYFRMKYYDAHKDQVLVSEFTLSILILLKQESSTIFPLPFLRISAAYRTEFENEVSNEAR